MATPTVKAKAAKAKSTKARTGNAKPKRDLLQLIHGVVDKGATAVEEIHRSIATMPLKTLEEVGVFEKTAEEVRNVQSEAIGGVYNLIRDINKRVEKFSTEILDDLSERSEHEHNRAE
jgi:hypothetical protein